MQPDKLVTMANQIAAFFRPQGKERAVPQIADHIRLFWDLRMRREIVAHLERGGAGLDELAKLAVAELKAPAYK
jgi:formate dehydrogenase subunit delta